MNSWKGGSPCKSNACEILKEGGASRMSQLTWARSKQLQINMLIGSSPVLFAVSITPVSDLVQAYSDGFAKLLRKNSQELGGLLIH